MVSKLAISLIIVGIVIVVGIILTFAFLSPDKIIGFIRELFSFAKTTQP